MSTPTNERRSAPLSVMVRDGALVILIGIDTLLTVAESGPEWPRLKVPDVDAFALALANQIDHDEDETGRTPLMKLIDDSIRDLVEAADPSIDYDEDAMPEEVSR